MTSARARLHWGVSIAMAINVVLAVIAARVWGWW